MIILASASPRRKEILSTLGVDFKVFTVETDETSGITDPCMLTEELASRKGRAVWEKLAENDPVAAKRAVIISADTVVYANGRILGKPTDEEDALEMLRMLSGNAHAVVSGVAVTLGGVTRSASCMTAVKVDKVPEDQLRAYAYSGEPLDKAGAYAIQGHFSPWISAIEGCYFNVVGLPVNCLNKLFKECTGEYLI
jgi:septum formation protein